MTMNSLDIAVLLEKTIILNGLIAFGNKEERKYAKQEMEKLLPVIRNLANQIPECNQKDIPLFE